MINSVIWDNRDAIAGSPSISYSIVNGGWYGAGNSSGGSLFVDTANNDYHLLPGTPVIDSGADPTATGISVTDDLYNNLRPRDGDGAGSDYKIGAIEQSQYIGAIEEWSNYRSSFFSWRSIVGSNWRQALANSCMT